MGAKRVPLMYLRSLKNDFWVGGVNVIHPTLVGPLVVQPTSVHGQACAAFTDPNFEDTSLEIL